MNRKTVRYVPRDSRTTEGPESPPEPLSTPAPLDRLPDPLEVLSDPLEALQDTLRAEADAFAAVSRPTKEELKAARTAARIVERELRAKGVRLCEWCFEEFPRTRKDRRFCSTLCRVKAFQDRRARDSED